MQQSLKSHEVVNEFGRFEVYERFLVATMDRNADRKPGDFGVWIFKFLEEMFDRPFGYVGNRANLNAGYPSLFVEARKRLPLWSSFALVSYSVATSDFFAVERLALQGFPHELFLDLREAMRWTDEVISKTRGGVDFAGASL